MFFKKIYESIMSNDFVKQIIKEFKILFKNKSNVGLGFILFGIVYSIIVNIISSPIASVFTVVFIVTGLYIIGMNRIQNGDK